MHKFKYPLILATIALLTASTSNAMLKKTYPKFDELIELERLTGEKTDEKTLKAFYRGRFEEVVIGDINTKQPYTDHLGLKITPHGDLSLERLPMTCTEGEKIAKLLLKLLQEPLNMSVLKTVQDFYATKKNPHPVKNADAFFPEIVVKSSADASEHLKKLNQLEKAPEDLYAFFDSSSMKIIVGREYFNLEMCRIILHEFVHFRQYIHGLESGAGYLRTLNKPLLPLKFALDFEAEFESIKGHPNKHYLLKQTAKEFSPSILFNEKIITNKIRNRFPYLTEPVIYNAICNQIKLANNDPNPELTKAAQRTTDLFYEIAALICKKNKATIEQEKNGINISGLGGNDYPGEILKLKKKLGLLPT